MSWEIIKEAGRRSVERYSKQKAAEATNNFIIYTIITSIISIILSFFLPIWVVIILFAIIGLFRFISSYDNIKTAYTARNFLKNIGIWNKNNDKAILRYIIWGITLFIVIKIIKYFIILLHTNL